jgi:hypothetical protein
MIKPEARTIMTRNLKAALVDAASLLNAMRAYDAVVAVSQKINRVRKSSEKVPAIRQPIIIRESA